MRHVPTLPTLGLKCYCCMLLLSPTFFVVFHFVRNEVVFVLQPS